MERPGEAVREGSLEEASKTEGSITWQGRKKVQENYTHLFSGMAGSTQALPFMSLFAPHQGPNNTEGEAPPTSGKEPQGAPCWPIMEAQPSLPSLPCWARQLWEASQQPDFPEWGSLKSGKMDKRGTERKEGKEGRENPLA